MTHDSTEGFEFDLGFDNDSYDPLEDLGPDDDELDDEGANNFPPLPPTARPCPHPHPKKSTTVPHRSASPSFSAK